MDKEVEKEKCELCDLINASDASAGNRGSRLDTVQKLKAFSFIGCVAGVSVLAGFGFSFSQSRKLDPGKFQEGLTPAARNLESGTGFAARALGRATVYAVSGVSLVCFTVWKLVGAKDLHEFRYKVAEYLPRVRRNDPPTSRTEFESLTDLMGYLENWGKPKDAIDSTEVKT